MQQALVYRYGLLDPTLNGELVADQIHRAHKYQNLLIEIERNRRVRVREILSSHSSVEELGAAVKAEQEKLEAIRTVIKNRKQAAHLSKIPTEKDVAAETKKETGEIKARLRDLRAQLKEGKQKLKDDPEIQALIKAENEVAHDASLIARKNCGVYWGTYLQIEQAVDAAKHGLMDPRFQRWTGDGAIAVQLQHGLYKDGLLSATDSRAQLNLDHLQVVPFRSGRKRPRLKIRIGTENNEPLWAEWPLIYHRPIPNGTMIKWIKVVRRRIAGRDDWSAHLTIETPMIPGPSVPKDSVVVVDLGWRKDSSEAEETLRAGGWIDHTGEGADIFLNPRIRSALRKVEDLRSIRDKNLNQQREAMISWRDTQELAGEHKERMGWLGQWRSPARFAGLAFWWKDNRIKGDEQFFRELEAWRRHDKHLWQWEANQRKKSLLRRREDYRVLAAKFARKYESLVLERLNLSDMARIPAPEASMKSHPQARSQRFETAPSELRQALILAFKKNGRRIFTVQADGPAVLLWSAWKEGKDVEEMLPPTPRASRFKKKDEEQLVTQT